MVVRLQTNPSPGLAPPQNHSPMSQNHSATPLDPSSGFAMSQIHSSTSPNPSPGLAPLLNPPADAIEPLVGARAAVAAKISRNLSLLLLPKSLLLTLLDLSSDAIDTDLSSFVCATKGRAVLLQPSLSNCRLTPQPPMQSFFPGEPGVAPRKAAVMQICGDTSHCYVIHIIHSGIPPILQSFLEDPKYLKVGVCIANDAYKVLSDYNVRVQPLEDLSSLANIKLAMPRKWSLASLTEMLACKELEKPNKIRLGNWEVDVLSKGHLEYAATDAFASWHLYEVLRSFSDASDNQNEEKASC